MLALKKYPKTILAIASVIVLLTISVYIFCVPWLDIQKFCKEKTGNGANKFSLTNKSTHLNKGNLVFIKYDLDRGYGIGNPTMYWVLWPDRSVHMSFNPGTSLQDLKLLLAEFKLSFEEEIYSGGKNGEIRYIGWDNVRYAIHFYDPPNFKISSVLCYGNINSEIKTSATSR